MAQAAIQMLAPHNKHSLPPCQHLEQHFDSPEVIRDIVIGLSDGLTVPFALAAGLSSLGNPNLVVTAGLAELLSGAISMGLGGYLAARSEADHYDTERKREEREVVDCLEDEIDEIVEILEPYGLDRDSLGPVIEKLKNNPEKFVDFMMKFELNLEKPDPKRSWISAITIGLSYFIGGLIPLIPYFMVQDAMSGFWISIVVTVLCLMLFGYAKSYFIAPDKALMAALQTAMVGILAAGSAFGLVRLIENNQYEIKS
ncbi:5162_t:CDS:2 [Ambispora gerdemannii]|uniref:5162_t:CDS:1 n=1 Tax=Ambispora gerdemannii TaxID=144530 RepID=A0A9N8Z0L6_9GLOM|nr:5162_t:CDS:2 [Ambispora gerdemannii]